MIRYSVHNLDLKAWAAEFRKRAQAAARAVADEVRTEHTSLLLSGRTPTGRKQKGSRRGGTPLVDTGRLARGARVVETSEGFMVVPPQDRVAAVQRLSREGYETIFTDVPRRVDAQKAVDETFAGFDSSRFVRRLPT